MNKKLNILFCLLIFLNLGCKKNPLDYRTKYLGDYDFVRNYTSWTPGGPTTSGTISKTGKVEYGDKGEIKIVFDNNDPTHFNVFQIDRKGNLTEPDGTSAGKFESRNSVHYDKTYTSSGGGGSSTTTGTKK